MVSLLHLGVVDRTKRLGDFHSKFRFSLSSLPSRICVSQISMEERNIVVSCIIFFS